MSSEISDGWLWLTTPEPGSLDCTGLTACARCSGGCSLNDSSSGELSCHSDYMSSFC